MAVGYVDYLPDRVDGAQRIGDMVARHDTGAAIEEGLVCLQV